MSERQPVQQAPKRQRPDGGERSGRPEPPAAANGIVLRALAGAWGGRGFAAALAALGGSAHLGNAVVQRALAGDGAGVGGVAVQRDGPQLQAPAQGDSLGWKPPAESGNQLRLDPEIESQLRAINAVQAMIQPQQVAPVLTQIKLPTIPPNLLQPPAGGPSAPPITGPPAPTLQPPPLPTEFRPGTSDDVWRAVMADPLLGPAVQDLQDRATEKAKADWSALSTGGKVALVSTSVVVAGGAAAGILSDPASRNWVAETLKGTVYPVPKVPGLGVQLDLAGNGFLVGLHLDVGQLLPVAFGFGPSDSTALGGPPNPYQGLPAQRVASGAEVDPAAGEQDIAGELAGATAGGSPLAAEVRRHLEERLNADLSSVRVHTGSQAAHLARAIDAVAFTTGQHIYFSDGAFQPGSPSGQKLIAHEAVHAIQQAAGPVAGTPASGVSISDPTDRYEREAARVSEAVTGAGPVAAPVDERDGGRAGGTGAAVQRQAATATPPAPGTVAGQVAGAMGAPSTKPSVSASVTIPAGQTISNKDGNWVHTVDDVTVLVYVSGSTLSVSFSPKMVITAVSEEWYYPNPDIYLTEAWYDFAAASYGVSMSAPRYAMWLGAAEKTLSGIGEQVLKLPGKMRSPGYDPFTDPTLIADLQTIAQGASRPAGSIPELKDGEFTAQVTLGADVSRDLGGASIVLPAGAQLSLSVRAMGKMPTTMAEFADLRIASIEVNLRKEDAELRLRVADTDLPVVWVSRATLLHGGKLDLSYALVNEVIGEAFRQLVAGGVVPGTLEQATADPRSPAARAIVDAAVSRHLEPLIKQAVLANRTVIPGLDLARSLGLDK